MKFTKYVKDNINIVLGFILYCLIILAYMKAMKIAKNAILIIMVLAGSFFIFGFVVCYWKKNRYLREIQKIQAHLPEKYLISEVMEKPKTGEELAYFRILQKANKSMLENVMKARTAQKSYQEYIESWVHEIKIPITSVKLLCENHKSEVTPKIEDEIEKIYNYVEQALFYARLDQVSNDFMIREVNLGEIIKNVLARNKKMMIQNQMKVEIEDYKITAYTDEKWLEFILNQIMINSVQYKAEKNPEIKIELTESKENVRLSIKDNGIGVKASEIERIFEKGFTGTNGRRQKKSTGMGLYLCKRLCQELDMEIEAESKENEYMKITIIIPKNEKINKP